MKKILTLILCWLLAFSAMAETFKISSVQSVAGGYVTSLNKLDGSMENGITGWTASTGSPAQTSSTQMQGNYLLSWAPSATGTLDSPAMTITATNTWDFSAQLATSDFANTQICAVVNSVENGCKVVAQNTDNQRVSWVGQLFTGDTIKLRVKYLGSSATIKTDDYKLEPWSYTTGQTVVQESITYTGYVSGTTGGVLFKTKDTSVSNESTLLSVVTSGGFTKYVVLKRSSIVAQVAMYYNSATLQTFNLTWFKANGSARKGQDGQDAWGAKEATMAGIAEVGDYFIVTSGVALSDSTNTHFSISATALSDNVQQTWDAPSDIGEIKYLPQNIAPNGFISAQGSILASTATGSATHYGENYKALYKVLWNIATTASSTADAYYISSAKGASADDDWTAGKTIKIDESGYFQRAYKSGLTEAVGAKQGDAFQGHVHLINHGTDGGAGNVWVAGTGGGGRSGAVNRGILTPYTDGANGTPRTASETRPLNVAKYAFIRYAVTQPTILNLPTSQINEFSAQIGTTANSHSNMNVNWISAVSKSGTNNGITTITVPSGIFSAAPNAVANAVVSGQSAADFTVFYDKAASTTTSLVFYSTSNGSSVNQSFSVIVQKSTDYTPPGVIPLNVPAAGMNYTDGAPDKVHNFSFSYGTTNAGTVCSASPCSYLDQIGNYVTSVTRVGAGSYSANFTKTFSKLKCTISAIIPSSANSARIFSCLNCSSTGFDSWKSSTEVSSDSYGTVVCQGQ